MKKILSLILVFIMICSALVSCGDSETPEGMKSATLPGEPFVLYVPENFVLNTESGISSAYLNAVDSSVTVTARYYTPSEGSSLTLESFMNTCADSYAMRLESFRKTSDVSGETLGGEDARRLEYIFTKDGKTYTAIQRTAEFGGDFVSLNIYTTGDAYELYGEYITAVLENFKLVEKDGSADLLVTDKKTPEGMRIASSDIVEYRLYVPKNWVCNPNSGVSEAYHPETKANVTLTSFSPNDEVKGKTLAEYCDYCVSQYEKTVNGFEVVEKVSGDIKAAQKDTILLTFTSEYDGVLYKTRQVMFYAGEYNLYYTITYTVLVEDFDTHLDDLRTMISAFCFR